MSAEDVNFFFTLREQVKLYHWQTHEYSRHKATDDLIDSLDKTIDEYVETYMGKYGRPKLGSSTNTFKLVNMSESHFVKFVKSAIKYLEGPFVKKLKPQDTDLVNLRDEMMGELNKILYLSTLN
jgi:hypothetical protein